MFLCFPTKRQQFFFFLIISAGTGRWESEKCTFCETTILTVSCSDCTPDCSREFLLSKIKLKGQTSHIRSSREWYHWPWLVRTSLCTANTANSKQIIPEKEVRGLSPSFQVHVFVSDLYIPTIGLPILLQENMWTEPYREYINRKQVYECGDHDHD